MARRILTVLSALLLVVGLVLAPFTPAIAASPDPTLMDLVISAGTLTPAFSANTTSYTASVANVVSSVTVTPAVSDNTMTIRVDGTTVASGTPSAPVVLAVGSNVITIEVASQNVTGSPPYTVTVTRAAPAADVSLSNLVISAGTLTPAFSANITSYTASVGNVVSSVTVTPTVSDNTATVRVNGTPVTSGTLSPPISLIVGSNVITIEVTSQNVTGTPPYTVTVTRAAPAVDVSLSNLVISAGTLTPAFSANITSYTASVGNVVSSVTVTPTVSDNTATVRVNGTPVTSGTLSPPISLSVGSINVITIEVTSQNVTGTPPYTVTVTRAAPAADVSLSNLVISAGTLTPPFSANTTSYTASVANAVSSVTVTPAVSDNTMTIRVDGTTVASGSPSLPISLIVGSNVITIDVTSQNVTGVPPYTVTVNRAALAMAISSVSPSSGPTTGGTNITITGTGFTGASAVTVGGTAAVFSTPDDTHIVATTPPGAAGARDVAVTRPGSSATRPGAFTYVAPPPAGGDGGGGGFAGGGGGGAPASPGETNLGAFTNSEGLFNLAGAAVSQDGKVRIAFGRGVLARDRNGSALKSVSILPLADPAAPPADSRLIGLVYELGPAGAVFRPAITLTVSYDPSELPAGFEEKDLVLATWDATAGKWIELPTSNDPLMLTVTVSIEHFSVFGIIAHARPASFSVSGLSIVPGAVDIGQPVGISVTVRNDGNLGDSYRVALLVSGALESTRDLHLSGGGTETVTFSVSRSATGAYAVDLNGLTGSFSVRPPVVAGVAAFETRDLSVSPTSVRAGDRVTVSFTVTNTGRARGTYHAALKVRGSVTETIATEAKDVALEPGAGQTVTFVIANTTPGTYGIEVDRLFGAFEVRPAETGGQSVLGRWLIPGIALAAAAAMLAGFSIARRRRRVAGGTRTGG